jgi:hypothetical protein
MEWFRAFRSTFNDTVAQRFASNGACLHRLHHHIAPSLLTFNRRALCRRDE